MNAIAIARIDLSLDRISMESVNYDWSKTIAGGQMLLLWFDIFTSIFAHPTVWIWVVELTFGWLSWCRRLNRDRECLPETSETWIYIAMIRIMVRRLAWFDTPHPLFQTSSKKLFEKGCLEQ
jgi:hypothetical protein